MTFPWQSYNFFDQLNEQIHKRVLIITSNLPSQPTHKSMLSARLHQPIKPSVTWKEDWFSWKPNVCWSFNFMRQYSANATPFSLNCYRTIINRRKRVFTNQLELTWQKVRTCWSRINKLHFTMYMSNIDITKRKVSPSSIMTKANTW